jgi:transcriptional regulator with XRE-family HTH domain
MKQCEIAKQLGISKSYLSMILSRQRKANPEMAMKISSLFFVNSEARLSLKGRCPRPLDECATLAGYSGHILNFLRPDLVPRPRAMLMKSSSSQP